MSGANRLSRHQPGQGLPNRKPQRRQAPSVNTTAGHPAPVGGSAHSVLSVRSRKHEAKPSVSVNPTTSCKKLYEKIREIRQHPSKKIRALLIQKQSH